MKKRKAAIAGFLLAAVMGISVGYAAVSDLLTVDGTVQVGETAVTQEFDSNVYFSTEASDITYTTNIATASVIDPDMAKFDVTGLDPVNNVNEATVSFVIVNDNNCDAKIEIQTNNFTGVLENCLSVTYAFENDATVVPHNGELKVTFTIKIIGTPTAAINETHTISFLATPVNA